jgi:hypothetical protein
MEVTNGVIALTSFSDLLPPKMPDKNFNIPTVLARGSKLTHLCRKAPINSLPSGPFKHRLSLLQNIAKANA